MGKNGMNSFQVRTSKARDRVGGRGYIVTLRLCQERRKKATRGGAGLAAKRR